MGELKIIAKKNIMFFIGLAITSIAISIIYIILTDFISDNMFFPILGFALTIVFIAIASLKLPAITFSFSGKKAIFKAVPWGSYSDNDIDSWNWDIYIPDVVSVEIIKLTKEKRKYTSGRFLFNKYLKINIKGKKQKFIYISLFTNKQVKKIIDVFEKFKSQN